MGSPQVENLWHKPCPNPAWESLAGRGCVCCVSLEKLHSPSWDRINQESFGCRSIPGIFSIRKNSLASLNPCRVFSKLSPAEDGLWGCPASSGWSNPSPLRLFPKVLFALLWDTDPDTRCCPSPSCHSLGEKDKNPSKH